MSNLPGWPGASAVYSKAYRMLERMAENDHVRVGNRPWCGRGRGLDGRAICSCGCTPSAEMNDLIDALAKGDEERVKGLIMVYGDRFPYCVNVMPAKASQDTPRTPQDRF